MTTFLLATAVLIVCALAVLAQAWKSSVYDAARCDCPVCNTHRDA